ncbi:hypothetical protein LZ30DRAFT_205803 [Colletotrichum cereale]|nr:hypothetical protein LZ30DRAFT_205803 [Colletotrichum cereale]
MGSNRRHSFDGGSRPSPPDPKRARYEPVCINLVSDDDDGLAIPGETDTDHCPSPPAASDAAAHPQEDEETPEAKVNRLMPVYSRGLPPSDKKVLKYYVVWKGKQDGIFTSWDDCSKQVTGHKGAGFKSEKTLKDAKSLLREKLLVKYREKPRKKACEEQRSRMPPQYPSAVPGSAAPVSAASGSAAPGFAAEQPPLEDYEPVPLPEEPVLCQEQQDAMDLAMQGHNVFITG